MAFETEHKYLVVNSDYEKMATKVISLAQGYLSRDPERTVRIRIADDKAYLTVKGRNHGDTRLEFEYEVPVEDARVMLGLCEGRIIRKRRYIVPFEGMVWEVDRFEGELEGLTVAEIELPQSNCKYALPPFVGEEVTGNPAYYNSML